MLETVKDYLIGLGFAVDQGSFSSVNNLLKQFDKNTLNIAKVAETNLGKTVGLISDSLLTILRESVDVINQVTDADLQVERLARNLWTTEKNARAVTSALSAMGKDPDVDEIYRMTNEEYKRFVDIKNTLSSMELSTQGQETLRFLRDIKGDISLINGMLGYIRQWVVAFIGKYGGTTLTNFRNKVRRFVEYLKKNFIPIAETIGKWVARGLQLIEALGWGIEKLIGFIIKFKDVLAPFLGAAGILALLKMGPIGWLIFAFTSLALILEDIYTYTQGGKSIFGSVLSSINGFVDLESIKENADNIMKSIKTIHEYLGPVVKFLGSAVWETFKTIIVAIEAAFTGIATALEKIDKIGNLSEGEIKSRHLDVNPESPYFDEEAFNQKTKEVREALNAPFNKDGKNWKEFLSIDWNNTFLAKWRDDLSNWSKGVKQGNTEVNININGADDPSLVTMKVVEAIKANSNWGGIR